MARYLLGRKKRIVFVYKIRSRRRFGRNHLRGRLRVRVDMQNLGLVDGFRLPDGPVARRVVAVRDDARRRRHICGVIRSRRVLIIG